MVKTTVKNLADHITPLRMNGLKGRMLYLPSPKRKKKELLIVYGHHASIERMFGIAEDLNQYGAVTIPDLPGFGGMESFYRLREKPTLDNLADYLASFIKLRYKHKRINIIAISFGSVVVIRMLQKYPELAKKVDLLVSGVGFSHKSDLTFNRRERFLLTLIGVLGSKRFIAWLVRHTLLTAPVLRYLYHSNADNHDKLRDASKDIRDGRIDMEVRLWQDNDIRTWAYTIRFLLKLDLCNKQVDLPVYHIGIKGDRYLNDHAVEQHLRVIFKKFNRVPTKMTIHAPTVVATAKEAAPLIPPKIRKILAKP